MTPPKVAIGLFNFNPQVAAGDPSFSSQYCVQALLPFLEDVERKEWFKATISITGLALEFLSERHPQILILLRKLIKAGRVELISSVYISTLWPAFPLSDLVQSITINQYTLDRLDLPRSRIFFCDECLFGFALAEINKYFDYVICSEESVRYSTGLMSVNPVYRLGSTTVIVGGNHLAGMMHQRREVPRSPMSQSGLHSQALDGILKTLPIFDEKSVSGHFHGIDWLWYHLGSGHSYSCATGLNDRYQFSMDPDWRAFASSTLYELIIAGYEFLTLHEYAGLFASAHIRPLPHIADGSWTPRHNRNLFSWMGRQKYEWEDHCGVAGLAWKSRSEVVRCENILSTLPAGIQQRFALHIDGIWKQQLHAETVGGIGGPPSLGAMDAARRAAVAAMTLSSELRLLTSSQNEELPPIEGKMHFGSSLGCERIHEDPGASIIGGEGTIHRRSIAQSIDIVEVDATALGCDIGVRFPREGDSIAIWHGAGSELHKYDLRSHHPGALFLALPNGLIGVGYNKYIVRINRCGVVAARVSKHDPWVIFAMHGIKDKKRLKMQFLVVMGSEEFALATANSANEISSRYDRAAAIDQPKMPQELGAMASTSNNLSGIPQILNK